MANEIKEITYGDITIEIPEGDVSDFLATNFYYEDWIHPTYECDIDSTCDDKCHDCDEKCDEGWCQYVTDNKSLQKTITEFEEMDAGSISWHVHEYYKYNTFIPKLIEELGKDEVYKIIEGLNWHV